MNPVTWLATIGDGWDRVAAVTRQAPRRIRAAVSDRPARRAGILTTLAVLVLYLAAIGDIAFSTSSHWSAAPSLRTAPENLLTARAPYLFEPILAWHPTAHTALFVSPVNVLLGAVVAVLAGTNLTVARYSVRHAACRSRGYGRLFGALPAFLLGFACCTPTVLLALGTGTGAALLPVLLPLRPVFYPLTLLMLLVTLMWGTSKLAAVTGEASPRSAGRTR